MRIIPIILFCFTCGLTKAAEGPKYPVKTIPDSLKNNVNVVVREKQTVFKILSKSKASYSVFEVMTILNENGKRHAFEVVGYDKLSKIKEFNGNVYDAEGKLIKKLKNSEIHDQSSFDGFTLYSDNRLKFADLSQSTYPYTVEFEYEVDYKFLFQIPDFDVVPDEKVSVQHAEYSLQFASELEPRYKALNISQAPERRKTKDDLESINWTFKNIKSIKREPFGPAGFSPKILAAPNQFEYDGYVGTMDSWDHFGQWIGTLNKDRNVLPEETKAKIVHLTQNLKTPEEKIKVLYEYLQSKTRYVGIQVGIGGYQPFEATVVDQNGYGDCKALSNYMVSMLAEIGIKSYYTLINAGKNATKINVDFPSAHFNHATVFVPNNSDTIWLECTSQTSPFGYAGTFTGDRRALAITNSGAEIVRTPVYTTEQNVQSRTAEVLMEGKGNAKAKVKTTYRGLQYENGGLHSILDSQFDSQKKWLQKNTDIPSFDITSFSMTNKKDRIPSAIVTVDLTLNRLATISGKRLFITPNLMNRSSFVPEKVENRKTNVLINTSYTDFDTIRYHLPQELYPEFLPEPLKLKSRFGEYEATLKLDQGNVVYIRKMVIHKGEYPPDSYAELIEFYKSIGKADNVKIVFLNKT
jgi:hypothetical protein